MGLTWKYNSFDELSPSTLYAIMRLRNEVFVVEQNCIYQDADHKDEMSFHVTGWENDTIVAYCRILPPGIAYEEASIGRVLTSITHRKSGYGRELMKQAVSFTLDLFKCKKITISAQLYLKNFYESIGFVQKNEPYLEDHILHTEMQFSG